jgi:hypothetical protein
LNEAQPFLQRPTCPPREPQVGMVLVMCLESMEFPSRIAYFERNSTTCQMTLTERINDDLKAAMKSGDQVRLNTVRSIRAILIELSKRGTGAITPEEEVQALIAAAKKRKEAIELYEKAARKDLADTERQELAVIQGYLPKQLTREEADAVVMRVIADSGASGPKDMGKVMGPVMKELKGKIDGAIIQELVKSRLGSAA